MAKSGGQYNRRQFKKTKTGAAQVNGKKGANQSALRALQERAKRMQERKTRIIELLAKAGLPELKLIHGDKYNTVLIRLRETTQISNQEKLELLRLIILRTISNPAIQNQALQRAKAEFK